MPCEGKGEQSSGCPKQASQRGESPGGREGVWVLNPYREVQGGTGFRVGTMSKSVIKLNGRKRFKQELESPQSGAVGEAEEIRRNPR